MKLKTFVKKITYDVNILGIALIVCGIWVMKTGILRKLILLGDEKYFIGSLCILFGIYFLWLGFIKRKAEDKH